MKVLKTFNDLHRSWFPQLNFNGLEDGLLLPASATIFDPQEPAYYITRSLFQEGKNVRDILKGNKTIKAIRKKFLESDFFGDDVSESSPGLKQGNENAYSQVDFPNNSNAREIHLKSQMICDSGAIDNYYCSDVFNEFTLLSPEIGFEEGPIQGIFKTLDFDDGDNLSILVNGKIFINKTEAGNETRNYRERFPYLGRQVYIENLILISDENVIFKSEEGRFFEYSHNYNWSTREAAPELHEIHFSLETIVGTEQVTPIANSIYAIYDEIGHANGGQNFQYKYLATNHGLYILNEETEETEENEENEENEERGSLSYSPFENNLQLANKNIKTIFKFSDRLYLITDIGFSVIDEDMNVTNWSEDSNNPNTVLPSNEVRQISFDITGLMHIATA